LHVNSRFAVAVHVLGLAMVASGEAHGETPPGGGRWCAAPEGEPVTSERLAGIVNTNPVVVRRVLGALREAGLVTSQPGPGGGWKLTRDAAAITLRDVYTAVEGEPVLSLPHRPPSEYCPFGVGLPRVLTECFQEAQAAMEERLSQVTIADVLEAVRGGKHFWEAGGCRTATTQPPLPPSISQ
jgi:Rrf2 family protein